MATWEALWSRKSFPRIVVEYLLLWKDRFYLFDHSHPFYQVTKEELFKRPIKAGRGQILPKFVREPLTAPFQRAATR